MNKWLIFGLALAGLAFYAAAYFVFKWIGFDVVQSLLLTVGLIVGITGLAFYTLGRIEDA